MSMTKHLGSTCVLYHGSMPWLYNLDLMFGAISTKLLHMTGKTSFNIIFHWVDGTLKCCHYYFLVLNYILFSFLIIVIIFVSPNLRLGTWYFKSHQVQGES